MRIGGLVVARQRPGTAKGVCFLLLEDEDGTVNLIVPPPVYERDRLTVRTEPLVLAEGRLERHASAGGAINVLVNRLVVARLARARGRDGAPSWVANASAAPRARRGRRPTSWRPPGPTTSGPSRRRSMSFAQGRRR